MIDLSGQPGELRFTLQVKRAATGVTETVEYVGRIAPATDTPIESPATEEPSNGSDPLDGCA